jgi:hypothetical protein
MEEPIMQSIPLTRRWASLLTLALITAAGAWIPPAFAKKAKEKPEQVATTKAKKPGKVSFENGSGESTAERDRRLLRECKGRPNAGACAGYTG